VIRYDAESVKDRIAEHNRQMWERLAKAGMNYTRPVGRPPRTRAGMRRFMDPRGRLKGVRLDGVKAIPANFALGRLCYVFERASIGNDDRTS